MTLKSLLTNLSQRNSPTNIAQHRAAWEAHKQQVQKASGWLTLSNLLSLSCAEDSPREKWRNWLRLTLEEAKVAVYPVGLNAYHSMREQCLPIFLHHEDLAEPVSSEYNCFNLEPAIHWKLTIVSLTPSLLSLTYVSNLPLFKAFCACGRQGVSIDPYYQSMSL